MAAPPRRPVQRSCSTSLGVVGVWEATTTAPTETPPSPPVWSQSHSPPSELLHADVVLRKRRSSPSVPLPVGASQRHARLPVVVFLCAALKRRSLKSFSVSPASGSDSSHPLTLPSLSSLVFSPLPPQHLHQFFYFFTSCRHRSVVSSLFVSHSPFLPHTCAARPLHTKV